MEKQDQLHLTSLGYVLGSTFCNQNLWKGGVCIFVCKDFYFSKICISHNCREEALETCANELETKLSKLIILSLYRVPTGDFNKFIKNLDDALKYLYKSIPECLMHGNIT